MNRKAIFDAVRRLLGRGFTQGEVARIDGAIDLALRDKEPARLSLGEQGKALIRKWEGCARRRADGRFEAYPDPGSSDGTPWTIGWGSTGPDIGPGTVWTPAECDARFERDIQRYANEVAATLEGASTTQAQFDALVSFHYNTGAIETATLVKLHKQGRFAETARGFMKWIFNDGRPQEGLRKRRMEERDLYEKLSQSKMREI